MESRKTGAVRHHCCNICGEVKPITLEHFYSDGHTRDGVMRFRTQCKTCLAMVRRLCRQGYVRDDAMAAVKRFITRNGARSNADGGSNSAGTGSNRDPSAMLGALAHEGPSSQFMGGKSALEASLRAEAAHAVAQRNAGQHKLYSSHPSAADTADLMHASDADTVRQSYHAEWAADSHAQDRAALWNTPDAVGLLQSKLLQSSIAGLSGRSIAADADPRAPMQTLAARILAQELLANNDAEIAATLFDLRRKQSERATLLNILEQERNPGRAFGPDALHTAAAALPHHLQQPPPSPALPADPQVLQLAQLHQLLRNNLGVELSDDGLQRLLASLAAQAAPPACKTGPPADSPATAPYLAPAPANAAWLLQALGQTTAWQDDVQRGMDVRLGSQWPPVSRPIPADATLSLPPREAPKAAVMSKLDSMLRAADAAASMQRAASGSRGLDELGIQGAMPSGELAAWPVGKAAAAGVPDMPQLGSLPEDTKDGLDSFGGAEDHAKYVAAQLLSAAPAKPQAACKREARADGSTNPELQEVAVQLLNGLLGGKKGAKQPAAKCSADDAKPASKSAPAAEAEAPESPKAKPESTDDRPLHDLRRSKNWSAIANHFADSNPMRVCRACGECKQLVTNFHVHRWRHTAGGRRVPQTFYWHCKQCHNHISAAIRRGETRSLAVATIQVSRRAAAAETCAANNKLRAQVQEELKAAHSSPTHAAEASQAAAAASTGSRKCTCCNTWQPLASFDHGDSGRTQLCTTCHKKIFRNGLPAKEQLADSKKSALADGSHTDAASSERKRKQPEAASSEETKPLGLQPIATHSRPMSETPPQQIAAAAASSGALDAATPTSAGMKRPRGLEQDALPVLKQRISEDLDASYVSVVSHASRLGNAAGSEPLSPASNEGASTSQRREDSAKGDGEAAGAGAVDVLAALQLLELKRGPHGGDTPRRSASADSGHAHALIAHSTHCDVSVESGPVAHA